MLAADAAFARGKIELAETVCRRVLAVDCENREALALLLCVLTRQNRHAEAIAFVDGVLAHFRAVQESNTIVHALLALQHRGFAPRGMLDIGAYQGEFTMFARHMFPAASVVMVEPQEHKQEFLHVLATDLGGDCHVRQCLLGERIRSGVEFHQLDTPFGSTGSSIYPEKSDFPRKVLTLPGRLTRLKGHHDFITLVARLVAEGIDVFFAPAKPMADAAWYASRKIPTVIATVTDPVVVEYAVSLARPGKHITGVTTANAELIGKRLQLLAEIVPGLERVGTPIEPALLDACSEEVTLMETAAKRLKLTLVQLPVKTDDPDVEKVVREAQRERVQALVTAPMTGNLEITQSLAVACGRARLPFVHDIPQFAADSLAVYGPDFEDIFRRAAGYVVRILKGEKPAEMPIEEPRDFKLIVNQAHARMLGLTLPQRVLVRADQVIG